MRSAIVSAAIIAATALGAPSVDAKGKSVAGTWTLKVEHLGLKLDLVDGLVGGASPLFAEAALRI